MSKPPVDAREWTCRECGEDVLWCPHGPVRRIVPDEVAREGAKILENIAAMMFSFVGHLSDQQEWSENTFGSTARTAGVVAHIRKELAEIEAEPGDLDEWIDVVILGLDGAWRSGYVSQGKPCSPEQIIAALVAKTKKNKARTWPDWRTAPADAPIEHSKKPPATTEFE